jgi:ankyrin repeat protein
MPDLDDAYKQRSRSPTAKIKQGREKCGLDALVDEAGPLLHRLVESGQEKAVAEAIRNHCDVNEKAEAGWTPLLYASAQGYPRIARILLDAGANPDIGNVRGFTPLMYSARYGNIEVCEILLDHHASVNIQDVYGMTALIVASRDGHIEIVKRLLRAKADLTIATREGKRALDFAYACGHGKIAKMLKAANVRGQGAN